MGSYCEFLGKTVKRNGDIIQISWLEDYPYHIDIQWWVFPIALFATLFVALTTVSFHSLKAAIGNPVDAIRYE